MPRAVEGEGNEPLLDATREVELHANEGVLAPTGAPVPRPSSPGLGGDCDQLVASLEANQRRLRVSTRSAHAVIGRRSAAPGEQQGRDDVARCCDQDFCCCPSREESHMGLVDQPRATLVAQQSSKGARYIGVGVAALVLIVVALAITNAYLLVKLDVAIQAIHETQLQIRDMNSSITTSIHTSCDRMPKPNSEPEPEPEPEPLWSHDKVALLTTVESGSGWPV